MILHDELVYEILDYFPLPKLYKICTWNETLLNRYGPILALPGFGKEKPIFHLKDINARELEEWLNVSNVIQNATRMACELKQQSSKDERVSIRRLLYANKDHVESLFTNFDPGLNVPFPSLKHIELIIESQYNRMNLIQIDTNNAKISSFMHKEASYFFVGINEKEVLDPNKNANIQKAESAEGYTNGGMKFRVIDIAPDKFNTVPLKQQELALFGWMYECMGGRVSETCMMNIIHAMLRGEVNVGIIRSYYYILEFSINHLSDEMWEAIQKLIVDNFEWFPQDVSALYNSYESRLATVYERNTDNARTVKRVRSIVEQNPQSFSRHCRYRDRRQFANEIMATIPETLPTPKDIIKFDSFSGLEDLLLASIKHHKLSEDDIPTNVNLLTYLLERSGRNAIHVFEQLGDTLDVFPQKDWKEFLALVLNSKNGRLFAVVFSQPKAMVTLERALESQRTKNFYKQMEDTDEYTIVQTIPKYKRALPLLEKRNSQMAEKLRTAIQKMEKQIS
jgi:hypothetical protein